MPWRHFLFILRNGLQVKPVRGRANAPAPNAPPLSRRLSNAGGRSVVPASSPRAHGGGGGCVDEAALLRRVLRAFVLCKPEIGYGDTAALCFILLGCCALLLF
jgi:hypothetical protein